MYTKVFLSIVMSWFLIIVIDNAGILFAKKLREHGSELVYELVMGEAPKTTNKIIHSNEQMSIEQFNEKVSAANREVAEKLKPYFAASLLVQILMVFLVFLVCTILVIGIVERNVRSRILRNDVTK